MKKVKVFLSTTMLAGAVAVMLPIQACSEDETAEISSVGTINGHEYVDLGLSVKWAACNVGASSPSDYGRYFAFGEVTEPSGLNYSSNNCRLYRQSIYNGMDVTEENIMGNPDFDAATANWGGTWRLPTKEEISELVDKCDHDWTTEVNSSGETINGYKVTGPNGNSIFLPAAGFYEGTTLHNIGYNGCYWSSTPDKSTTYAADYLYFLSSKFDLINIYYRYYGRSVRPVSE